jgi:hypothetical protein
MDLLKILPHILLTTGRVIKKHIFGYVQSKKKTGDNTTTSECTSTYKRQRCSRLERFFELKKIILFSKCTWLLVEL